MDFITMRFLLILLAGLSLTSCARVQTATYLPTLDIPPGAAPAPVMFSGYRVDLPAGQDIGVMSKGGRFCGWPYVPVGRNYLRDQFDDKSMKNAFGDILEAQGYDVVGNRNIMFDEDEDMMRGEYKIAARITDVQLDACQQESGNLFWVFTGRAGTEGEFFMTIDWTVYDNMDRSVVYKARTQGYSHRRVPNQEGLSLLITDAFEMAAHNLGTDTTFHELIFAGIRPAQEKEKHRGDDRPRLFDADEDIVLPAAPLSRRTFESDADNIRHSAVMIETGVGHGSGFFITKQGHILTNDHVVGDARRVRVNIPGRKEALPAEVLRRSDKRDAALLKLESIPADLAIATRPIRRDWPAVSETIFAVGAPQDRYLANTVTRGIVSAHRSKFVRSRKMDLIQADVEVHGGNSGGPLLDAYGNVVGIAVEAYTDGEGTGMGLNLFIPIADALAALDIAIDGDTPPPDKPLPLAPARMIQN